jgi:hypothetical protein
MNRVSKNQGLLLLTLVVLWIGLLVWQFGHFSEQERVPLTHVSGQRTVGKAPVAAASGGNLQVHLERLAAIKGQREATFATPRNIFASLLPQELVVEFVGPVITSTYYETLRFTLPSVYFSGDIQGVSGPDTLSNQWNYTWKYDGTNLPKIELITTDSAL